MDSRRTKAKTEGGERSTSSVTEYDVVGEFNGEALRARVVRRTQLTTTWTSTRRMRWTFQGAFPGDEPAMATAEATAVPRPQPADTEHTEEMPEAEWTNTPPEDDDKTLVEVVVSSDDEDAAAEPAGSVAVVLSSADELEVGQDEQRVRRRRQGRSGDAFYARRAAREARRKPRQLGEAVAAWDWRPQAAALALNHQLIAMGVREPVTHHSFAVCDPRWEGDARAGWPVVQGRYVGTRLVLEYEDDYPVME